MARPPSCAAFCMRHLALAALLLSLSLSGCGVVFQARSKEGPAAFGGARTDALLAGSCFAGLGEEGWRRGFRAFGFGSLCLLDLPFSFVGDLVLLPYSIWNELSEDGVALEFQIGPWPP